MHYSNYVWNGDDTTTGAVAMGSETVSIVPLLVPVTVAPIIGSVSVTGVGVGLKTRIEDEDFVEPTDVEFTDSGQLGDESEFPIFSGLPG